MGPHEPADRPGAPPAWCGHHRAAGVQARPGRGKGHRDPVLDIGRGHPVARQLRTLPYPLRGLPALESGQQGTANSSKITTTASVYDAATIMTARHFRHLPVTGGAGLLGLVDIIDVCQALINAGQDD